MKYVLSTLVFLSSFAIWAQPQENTAKESVKYAFLRSELTFENGQFNHKLSKVCEGRGEVSVFDLRSGKDNGIYPTLQKCVAESDGQKIEFSFYAHSALIKNLSVDNKIYGIFPYFKFSNGDDFKGPQAPQVHASTKNVNQKDLKLMAYSEQYGTCQNPEGKTLRINAGVSIMNNSEGLDCAVVNPVVYHVEVEFESK